MPKSFVTLGHSIRKSVRTKIDTECVTYLDYRSEMIIFELILTNFKSSIFLDVARAVMLIGLSLKPNNREYI